MRALYDQKRTNDVDRRVAGVARSQHGVFTREQAECCGATDGTVKWRLRAGRWERIYPKVYRLAGAATTWRQHALAACLYLGPTAVLSHRGAARLRNVTVFNYARAEVTVARSRNRAVSYPIKIHWRTEPVPDEDITTIDGIPVTKPARTLLDLASTEPREVVERCLDELLRRKLLSLSFLERWLDDPRRRRHPGAALVRRLVAERATIGVTESPLESDVLKLIKGAGLPIPMLQYVVRNEGRFVARLDFAYPDALVAVEADGFRHHDERTTFDHERARGNRLEALGWRVLRLTSKHVEQDPAAVAGWICRALQL